MSCILRARNVGSGALSTSSAIDSFATSSCSTTISLVSPVSVFPFSDVSVDGTMGVASAVTLGSVFPSNHEDGGNSGFLSFFFPSCVNRSKAVSFCLGIPRTSVFFVAGSFETEVADEVRGRGDATSALFVAFLLSERTRRETPVERVDSGFSVDDDIKMEGGFKFMAAADHESDPRSLSPLCM